MYLFKTELPDSCELPEESLSENIKKNWNEQFSFFFLIVFKWL